MSEKSVTELLDEIDRLGEESAKRKEAFLNEMYKKVALPFLLLQKIKKESGHE
jgi:hypothetical protein